MTLSHARAPDIQVESKGFRLGGFRDSLPQGGDLRCRKPIRELSEAAHGLPFSFFATPDLDIPTLSAISRIDMPYSFRPRTVSSL
jgi:hypothetical protein